MNLLIYCYIMGKISNLKKEHLLHEEDLLHIYIKSLIVSGCDKRSQFKCCLLYTSPSPRD